MPCRSELVARLKILGWQTDWGRSDLTLIVSDPALDFWNGLVLSPALQGYEAWKLDDGTMAVLLPFEVSCAMLDKAGMDHVCEFFATCTPSSLPAVLIRREGIATFTLPAARRGRAA